MVSPELQGHSVDRINEFRNIILDNNFEIEAICTKYYNIDLWKYEQELTGCIPMKLNFYNNLLLLFS